MVLLYILLYVNCYYVNYYYPPLFCMYFLRMFFFDYFCIFNLCSLRYAWYVYVVLVCNIIYYPCLQNLCKAILNVLHVYINSNITNHFINSIFYQTLYFI